MTTHMFNAAVLRYLYETIFAKVKFLVNIVFTEFQESYDVQSYALLAWILRGHTEAISYNLNL